MGDVKRIDLKKEGAPGGIEIASIIVHEEKGSFALNLTREAGVDPFNWALILSSLIWEVAAAFAKASDGATSHEDLLKEMKERFDADLEKRVSAGQQKGLDR